MLQHVISQDVSRDNVLKFMRASKAVDLTLNSGSGTVQQTINTASIGYSWYTGAIQISISPLVTFAAAGVAQVVVFDADAGQTILQHRFYAPATGAAVQPSYPYIIPPIITPGGFFYKSAYNAGSLKCYVTTALTAGHIDITVNWGETKASV